MKKMKFNQTVGLRDLNYISIRQLAKICEELIGIEAKIEWGALPYRGNEFFSAPNLSPILEGWRPKISLLDGIKSML
jgi:nucleoside-diphosphate-sugar epimerase